MEKQKKLLIADSDRDIIKKLESIASGMNFKPLTATSGRQALEVFKRRRPGVAVIDYVLSDITGDRIIKKIKDIRTVSQPIVITDSGEYEKVVKALRAGAADYIKKPFKDEIIKKSIRRAYDKFRELRDTTEIYNILVLSESGEIRKHLKKSLSGNMWNIHFCENSRDCFKYLSTHMMDIVIIDLDCSREEGFRLLGKLKKYYGNLHTAVMTENGDEDTVMEAMRLGAEDYVRKPGDLNHIPQILQNAVKALEIKRICNLKKSDFTSCRNLTARITEVSNINIEIFINGSKKTYTFARRLLDNIPVCIAVADEKKRIIYTNKFLRRNAEQVPRKIDKDFHKLLSNIIMEDVPLKILQREIDNLISSGEEIETITLGKKEYLTLTTLNLNLVPEKTLNAVLIIAAGR